MKSFTDVILLFLVLLIATVIAVKEVVKFTLQTIKFTLFFCANIIDEWITSLTEKPSLDSQSIDAIFLDNPEDYSDAEESEDNREETDSSTSSEFILPPLEEILNRNKTHSLNSFLKKELQQNILYAQGFPVLPENWESLSVRRLQTLCDRVNKAVPKTIKGYRSKKANKRGMTHQIKLAYNLV